jgi:hypothetical protein
VLDHHNLAGQGFQTEGDLVVACAGSGLKKMLQGGRVWLEVHVQHVNDLNVFPVPDGDTGTNMLQTLAAALESAAELNPDAQAGRVAAAAAQGALLGARGNSGQLLSIFLGGLAESLAGLTTFTATDFAQAAQLGVEKAYQAVPEPVEGTILTVAREAAEAAQQSANNSPDLLALFTRMVEAAQKAEANTPELLSILQEAGVTDAGGQGLVYILEGGLRFLQGVPVEAGTPTEHSRLKTEFARKAQQNAAEHQYGYDVQFLIRGDALNVTAIRAYIQSIGWSTLVSGNERLVKVHIHTRNPGEPLSYGAQQGALTDVVVENMEEQAKQFVREHSLPSQMGVVAVVPGAGLARIFKNLGATQVVAGGQTMNPSTQELLTAIEEVGTQRVLLLPNNSNIILTARQVQSLSDKQVGIVPTRSIPQGLAAMLAFDAQAPLAANQEKMLKAAQGVQTLEITSAARDTTWNKLPLQAGTIIGLLNDQLVSQGQSNCAVALDTLAQMELEAHELLDIYFGRDCSPQEAALLADAIKAHYPDLEVHLHEGGQPHYHYIISVE